MDLSGDEHNCGACKSKCKFTNLCCRGECVNLAYDKRHCGLCGNKCMPCESHAAVPSDHYLVLSSLQHDEAHKFSKDQGEYPFQLQPKV
ncbi:hypothetical protein R6Q57_009272 [Mikania cordata]